MYEDAIKYLLSREKFGIRLGLDNISRLAESLGSPQKSFRAVHVAGTKGKGSVCAFISSILRKQGYKVGMYTSPHLVDFRERIMINGKKIPKKDVARLVSVIKPLVRKHTFFEIVTAMAFLYFREQKVKLAVVEVGMGGRLDATNIVNPEACVITNVSVDHEAHLGSTVKKIAFEKAGIIKPGVPVVTAAKGEALSVIKKICRKKGSRLIIAKPKKIKISLKGDFQMENASAALEAVKILRKMGIKVSKSAIAKGFESTEWRGRMDFVSERLLLDCAHNPASAQALAKEIKKLGKDVYLVLGIMKDKDIKAICSALSPLAKETIITKPKIGRAAMPNDIAAFASGEVSIVYDVGQAVEYAKFKADGRGLVVVTGSIFTVGEAFSALGIEM